MTTIERAAEGAIIDDGQRVQNLADGLVRVFESVHCPDLALGVQNVVEAFEPSLAEVALLGFYATIAETELRRHDWHS